MELLEAQGQRYQDINAVVISIPGSDTAPMVIGAPTVEQGTGQMLARSALDKASEWTDLTDVVGGVFDTASSNTDIHKGAMTQVLKQQS